MRRGLCLGPRGGPGDSPALSPAPHLAPKSYAAVSWAQWAGDFTPRGLFLQNSRGQSCYRKALQQRGEGGVGGGDAKATEQ